MREPKNPDELLKKIAIREKRKAGRKSGIPPNYGRLLLCACLSSFCPVDRSDQDADGDCHDGDFGSGLGRGHHIDGFDGVDRDFRV